MLGDQYQAASRIHNGVFRCLTLSIRCPLQTFYIISPKGDHKTTMNKSESIESQKALRCQDVGSFGIS